MSSHSIVTPDPRPAQRVRDPDLLRQLHLEWKECALCGAVEPRTLHHISRHPRDDLRGNLVMLCGSGTTGCHGLIEQRDPETEYRLREHVLRTRGDVITYLYERLGAGKAQAWLRLGDRVDSEALRE